MENDPTAELRRRHLRITEPSPWVRRFAPLVKSGESVLDIASGGGRHARHFLKCGHPVTAIDQNDEPLEWLCDETKATVIQADMETGPSVFAEGGPLAGLTFGGIVVVNYLYRDMFEDLLNALKPGGVLIYETFARGNEEFARPRNPDHLLKSGELLDLVQGRLQVVAYEHGVTQSAEIPGVKQRLTAVNDLTLISREDGDPSAHPIDNMPGHSIDRP